MKYLRIKNPRFFRFDFEIGTLIKSPCKTCKNLKRFPECFDECALLDEIQTKLCEGVSCTNGN